MRISIAPDQSPDRPDATRLRQSRIRTPRRAARHDCGYKIKVMKRREPRRWAGHLSILLGGRPGSLHVEVVQAVVEVVKGRVLRLGPVASLVVDRDLDLAGVDTEELGDELDDSLLDLVVRDGDGLADLELVALDLEASRQAIGDAGSVEELTGEVDELGVDRTIFGAHALEPHALVAQAETHTASAWNRSLTWKVVHSGLGKRSTITRRVDSVCSSDWLLSTMAVVTISVIMLPPEADGEFRIVRTHRLCI